MLSEKASEEILNLSKNISSIDNSRTFVDIDYIVNLVHDLDFEGLLYLRNVVEELIKKWVKLDIYIVSIYHHEWISCGCL